MKLRWPFREACLFLAYPERVIRAIETRKQLALFEEHKSTAFSKVYIYRLPKIGCVVPDLIICALQVMRINAK
jgi:hypothetical protein